MRSVKLCGAPALSFRCPDPYKINRNQFKFYYNSNKMRSVKLCGAPALSFRCPDPCKIDRNQFKFYYNSNKMRSAAFAVEANLVFLTFFGVQGLDKAFPFKWNTRVFNVFGCPGSKSGTGLVRLGCT